MRDTSVLISKSACCRDSHGDSQLGESSGSDEAWDGSHSTDPGGGSTPSDEGARHGHGDNDRERSTLELVRVQASAADVTDGALDTYRENVGDLLFHVFDRTPLLQGTPILHSGSACGAHCAAATRL